MRKFRSILAGAAAGIAVLTLTTAASATTEGPDVDAKFENGVLSVSSSMPHQPLFGGFVDTNTGRTCIGFSYQVPQCAKLPLDAISIGSSQSLPVRIDANKDDDGIVGVFTGTSQQPLLSVWWNTRTGAVCAGFSYQIPFCIQNN